MKILLVTTELASPTAPTGGLGNFVRRFSFALAERGHRVRILICSPSPQRHLENGIVIEGVSPSCSSWMRSLNTLSVRRLHPAVSILSRARGVADRISELARAGEVDVVQATNLGGVSLFHPRGIPLVIRLSSDRMLYRKFGAYDHENWITSQQQYLLERKALSKAAGIYTSSRLVASTVEKSTGRAVTVIPPPVFIEDLEEDETVFQRTVAKKPFLLFFGRINRLKGISVLAQTLGAILGRHPELNMVVAGSEHHCAPEPHLTQTLVLGAAPHADRLILTGVLPHTQLRPFLSRATAVVLPSLVDNLPNSLLEAMLHGKVVIGTRGASFDELITDGINGILCEPGNPESLEKAIEHVLGLSPTIKEKMGRAAQIRIEGLRPSIIIPRIVELLEKARATVNEFSAR